MVRRSAASLVAPLLLVGGVAAHGGAYRGPGSSSSPGDTVAPRPSAGGSAVRGPGAVAPGPARGPTPTPGLPGAPLMGPACSSPFDAPDDLTAWQRWWGYNSPEFVDVKAVVRATELVEGSDTYFLGHLPKDQVRDQLMPSQTIIRGRVVPVLAKVLEAERDHDLVTGALIALAKVGDEAGPSRAQRMADRIRPFLADPNQEIAETATVCLGILANQSSVSILEALLLDKSVGRDLVGRRNQAVPWRTRAFAAYGLGLIGHQLPDGALRRRIIRLLMEQVTGPAREMATNDVSVACVSALGLVSAADDPELVLRQHDPDHPWEDLRLQVEWLLALADDSSQHDLTRAHAPIAIARLLSAVVEGPERRANDALRQPVGDRWLADLARGQDLPRQLEQSLVIALGRIGTAGGSKLDERIRSALIRRIDTGDQQARKFALVALAEVAARPGDEGDPFEATPGIRRRLVALLVEGGAMERPWAGLALGVLGHRLLAAGSADPSLAVDAALLGALERARAPREVGAFAIAVGMRRQEEAVPLLVDKLDHLGDDDARGYVTLSLGMLGDRRGLAPIRDVLRVARYRPELLRQAAMGLGLLGDKNVVPEMIDMLQGTSSLAAQASLASGLGAIGDARSIEPLAELLGDDAASTRARAFAAVALGIIADKEDRTWNAKLSIGINYRANTVTLTDGQGAGILEIL